MVSDPPKSAARASVMGTEAPMFETLLWMNLRGTPLVDIDVPVSGGETYNACILSVSKQ